MTGAALFQALLAPLLVTDSTGSQAITADGMVTRTARLQAASARALIADPAVAHARFTEVVAAPFTEMAVVSVHSVC